VAIPLVAMVLMSNSGKGGMIGAFGAVDQQLALLKVLILPLILTPGVAILGRLVWMGKGGHRWSCWRRCSLPDG